LGRWWLEAIGDLENSFADFHLRVDMEFGWTCVER
jgi:hypothetical protein